MPGNTMTHVHQHTTYSSTTNYRYEGNGNSIVSLNDSSYIHNSSTITEDANMTSSVVEQSVESTSNLSSTAERNSESASSILQSVKEQEAQFERLTRELEAERRSVADQLEQCKIGSQAGSVQSLISNGFDNHPGYIEQGADLSALHNGEDNDSSHLVDSCLRVLQERGIMQSDEVRGKSVAFDTRPAESHTYNGYDSRETTSAQSSRQNSYRQPEGAGMSRSEANYSLHTAATDSYGSYSQLNQHHQWQQQQSYGDYTDYGLPTTDPQAAQLSDGDYIDSSAAANYMNSYGDYPVQSGAPSDPSYSHTQYHADSYTYHLGDSQPGNAKLNGDYIVQGSYRSNPADQQSNYNHDYYESNDSPREQPGLYDSHTNGEHNSNRDNLGHSREQLGHSREQLGHSREQLGQSREQLGHSREQLGHSRDQLRHSRENMSGSTDQLKANRDQDYQAAAIYKGKVPGPFLTSYNNYNGDHMYENSVPGGEQAEPAADNYTDRQPSYTDRQPSYTDRQPSYTDRQPSYTDRQPSYNVDSPSYNDRRPSYNDRQPSYNDQSASASHPMLADLNLLYGSRQSVSSRVDADTDQQWRPPDLPEVIEYLSHPNDAIKANAAAYLQHLCYGNNEIKTKTRTLRGIPTLVTLLYNDIPEVHRNALGALLNLSRGYENDDNKRAIKMCGGIESLGSLLERSRDNDVRELITGILWNLSSLGELKKAIISLALKVLVNSVITPATGPYNRTSRQPDVSDISWSTEFRNATGVLRNVSSDGPYARKQLRECPGLIEALLKVTHAVNGAAEMDNKPVENIVCTLRNLSFRLMEVDYPDYYDKKASEERQTTRKPSAQESLSLLGCFGKSSSVPTIQYPCRTSIGSGRGEQLWQKELVLMYVPIISDCSNTDTLEAAVGAIQNLTACEWPPSKEFSEHMRKERALPKIVELLGLEEADNVVCGAAIALRNLALDKSNRILIGKYATEHLVAKLPPPGGRYPGDRTKASEETIRAVLAALYGVLKERDAESLEHASTLVNDCEGLERLISMSKSQKKFTAKTLRGVHQLLTLLWKFAALREVYKQKGYKESDFLSLSMMPKSGGNTGTMSVASTLTRPRSEPPSNTNTIARNNVAFREDKSDEHTGDPFHAVYPSSGTLPIQRPYYTHDDHQQPQDNQNSYKYQTQTSHTSNGMYPHDPSYSYQQSPHSYRQGSYSRQQSYDPNYPDTADHSNQPLNSSHQFSQSREELVHNGRSQNGHLHQSEPLYARVEKRKTSNGGGGQVFYNPGYTHSSGGGAVSMESLHSKVDYSFQTPSQQDTSAGVDSWV